VHIKKKCQYITTEKEAANMDLIGRRRRQKSPVSWDMLTGKPELCWEQQ